MKNFFSLSPNADLLALLVNVDPHKNFPSPNCNLLAWIPFLHCQPPLEFTANNIPEADNQA